jgi:hypothetical protein
MNLIQKLRARRIIARVARQQGITMEHCRTEIQTAIAAAWATTDPEIRFQQIRLVGEGRVPTPEELIFLISKETT